MATDFERLLRCFVCAKRLTHEYWMHTDGDFPEIGRIRVENVEKSTEIITGIDINKKTVPFEGSLIRGVTERYSDNTAKIYIRANQPIEWQKYASIKEYSHLLYDTEVEDLESDPVKTLKALTSNDPFHLDGNLPPAVVSERLAEILAVEIIYPLEVRDGDREFLTNGGEMSDLVEKRHVPAVHIERSCSKEAIDACRRIWEILNKQDSE